MDTSFFSAERAKEWMERREAIALPPSERTRRYERVRQLMDKKDVDCLIVCTMNGSVKYEADVRYFIGEFYKNQSLDEYVIFPKEGEPCFVITYAFRTAWAKLSWVQDVRGPKFFTGYDQPLDGRNDLQDDSKKVLNTLPQVIIERGYETATIAVSREVMTIHVYDQLVKGLPRAKFVESSDLMTEVRRLKSEFEIRLQEESAHIGDLAWERCKEVLRVGVLEHQVVAEWDHVLKLNGCEKSYERISADPLNPGFTHWPQRPKRMEQGDVVITQISPCFGGYFTQLIRGFSIGEPNAKIKGMATTCLQAHQEGASMLSPGMPFKKVTGAIEEVVKKSGYNTLFRSGRASIGMDLNEIKGKDYPEAILEPGMVVVIHPNATLNDHKLGMLSYLGPGDTYAITENGARRLTLAPQDLVCIA